MDYRRLIALLVAFVAVALAASQSASRANSDEMSAVTAVRIIGTAQHIYFGKAQHYGSLNELNAAGSLKQAEEMFTAGNDAVTPIGYAVRVIVSDDKKTYQVSVTHEGSPSTVGFFSDERGPIYEGHPLQ